MTCSSPQPQDHRETLQQLVERMYALFCTRFVQEQESDSLRKSLDHCIKLLHKCCESCMYSEVGAGACTCTYTCTLYICILLMHTVHACIVVQ